MARWSCTLKILSQLTYPSKVVDEKKSFHNWLTLCFSQAVVTGYDTLELYPEKVFFIFPGYDHRVSYAEVVPWKNIFEFSRLSLQAMTPWTNTLREFSQLTYPRKVVGGKRSSHNWLTLGFFTGCRYRLSYAEAVPWKKCFYSSRPTLQGTTP